MPSLFTRRYESYTATTDSGSVGSRLQKVEVVFIPKARLQTDVYTVEILNKYRYVGSLKVKLK